MKKLILVGVAATLLSFGAATLLASPESSSEKRARLMNEAHEEAIRNLGYDPWPPADLWASRPDVYAQFVKRLATLHACVLAKEGRTLEDEEDGAFGSDPWPADPNAVIHDPGFWKRLKTLNFELGVRCGEAQRDDETNGILACLRSCSYSHGACFGACQAPGPPAPDCVDSCDFWREICEIGCYFQIEL